MPDSTRDLVLIPLEERLNQESLDYAGVVYSSDKKDGTPQLDIFVVKLKASFTVTATDQESAVGAVAELIGSKRSEESNCYGVAERELDTATYKVLSLGSFESVANFLDRRD